MKTHRLAAFVLAVAATVCAQETRLANLSTRAQTGTGANVLTAGFVIGPGASKQVLIRAVGPTLGLAPFNLPGTLADPTLTVFGPDSSTNVAATNDNWGTPVGPLPASAVAIASAATAVGAFPIPTGSKDSAVLATLAPGNYGAQVTGLNGTTGIAIVEVYEIGAPATKLVNLSTLGQVGTGANIMIPGIVISAGGGTRRLLVRAAGPALGASPFSLPGTLANPTIVLTNSPGTPAFSATNDDWGTPVGTGAASATILASAFAQAGAFPFAAGSRDAALLVDLPPGSYTAQVTGVGGTSGLAIVEAYDITPASPPVVTLTATKSASDESGASAGEFTFTRSGDTLGALTVLYGVGGTATNGIDYPPLVGFLTIPAGQSSVKIPLQPYPDTSVESTETVTLTLAASSAYTIGSGSPATVSIADNAGTLYVATLRPSLTASGSAASGLATVVLSASGTVATVNVTFSNLSSGQVGAHLFLGNSTNAGDYVLSLPLGQVNGTEWNIVSTATSTAAQIIDSLRNGLIYVGLDSGNYPAGELRGAFLSALGSQTFTAPAAPPTVSLTNLTATDAARLLTQATFGAKQSEVDALTGGSVNTWLDTQLALPNSGHRAHTLAERDFAPITLNNNNPEEPFPFHRQAAWFDLALNGPDQLRQRVAFALSQILVTSDASLAGQQYTEGLANYYDILANNAFGSFRTLLEQVTLSPIMGTYLSSLKNAKADPVAGTNPDENYAREVMQLFTIGLVQLQPDGTLKLDSQGLPIPTYNQTTITEMAKIFTGWTFFSTQPITQNTFRRGTPDYINPMVLFPGAHEPGQKTIVNNTVIPANLGGTEDLKRALDTLVHHPNTAPFIARQLIQRLVTDNPSPGYVYRVAQQFGTDGNLGAMVRAILTDYEARAPAVYDDPGYGKLREPLLRFTNVLRSFGAAAATGHYYGSLQNPESSLAQAALRAPSVFNFFEPGYVYPGAIAAAGLVAPELQITTDTTAITVPNFIRQYIFAAAGTGANASAAVVLNLAAEQAIATNTAALLDRLNLLLCSGQLSAATRARITTAQAGLSANTSALERAQSALLLVATSPDGATQR